MLCSKEHLIYTITVIGPVLCAGCQSNTPVMFMRALGKASQCRQIEILGCHSYDEYF